MAPCRWLALLVAGLLCAAAPALAQEPPPGTVPTAPADAGPSGLLDSIRGRMFDLQHTFEEWRRAPYEQLQQNFNNQQTELRQELTQLQSQLDALRNALDSVQLTPGPPGPAGPAGPQGPRGYQGLPGNTQLAGESGPASQSVTGFDAFGNVLCSGGSNTAGVGVDCPDNLVSAADLRRCDLRSQDLSGRDLSYATLIKADLRTTLNGTDLEGADLRRAEFTGADLTNLNLTYANLTLARLGSTHIEGGDLSGAVLRKAELSLARTDQAKLAGADLSDASLLLSQHYGSDFSRANLSGADLRQSVFQDSSLFLATTSTSLEQARMINTICPDGVNSNTNANSCAGHGLR
jgi:uncharacterized protein YjbI with pentapeptide repeats/uncharacterized coiled-coil protein SlyX